MKFADLIHDDSVHSSVPNNLIEWRVLVLDWLLRGMFIFWLLILVWGIISILIISTPAEQSSTVTPALIGAYLIGTVVMLTIIFLKRLGYRVRAAAFLLLLYSCGIVDLLLNGIEGEGQLFLLAFVALSAVFFDLRRSIYALALSFFALVFITFFLVKIIINL